MWGPEDPRKANSMIRRFELFGGCLMLVRNSLRESVKLFKVADSELPKVARTFSIKISTFTRVKKFQILKFGWLLPFESILCHFMWSSFG